MTSSDLQFYTHLIRDLAEHFGPSTEFVVHDLKAKDPAHSIIAIENGHITGRKVGDGPSHVVVEALNAMKHHRESLNDRMSYLTKTDNGKTLKSSTIFLRDGNGDPVGVLGINTDITLTMAAEQFLRQFHSVGPQENEPEKITTNVADLLDSLIRESIELVGKPASLMSKDEKIRAIRFLNDSGAFLITKSGPKVCSVFGISKYTLYSYLDEAKTGDN